MSQQSLPHTNGLIKQIRIHLINMRLLGDDTVINTPFLPLLGFFLLHGTQDVPWPAVLGLLSVSLLLVVVIFGLNNVADAELDAHDPRKKAQGINPIAMGQLTRKEALIPLLCCSLLGLGLASWLSLFPWALLTLTVGVFYSLPPIRLKERAGMDLLTHGLVPLIALSMGMAAAQANYPLRALVGMAFVSIIAVKSETTNLIRDYESDREQGVKTTVVRLGVQPIRWLRLGLLLAAAGLIFFAGWYKTVSQISAWLVAVVVLLEILAIFRADYYLRTQRLLFNLNYAGGSVLIVLLSS